MSNPRRKEQEVDSAEFARILTKQAVAHVCLALGFTSTTPEALDCLTDVVQRYVESMAKRTMENTYRAGRTEPNIADVLQGFQQLPIPLSWTDLRDFAFSEDGFSNRYEKKEASRSGGGGGSSSSNSNSSGSGSNSNSTTNSGGGGGSSKDGDEDGADGPDAKEEAVPTRRGVEEMPKRWDQPFHHTVPSFPMPRKRSAPWGTSREAGGAEGSDALRPPHIPSFMPPLPPSSSRETSAGSGRSLAEIRLERLKRQRQGETALRSLGAPVAAAAPVPAGGSGGGNTGRQGASGASGSSSSGGKAGGISKIIIRLPSAGGGGGGGGGSGGGSATSNGGARSTSASSGGGGGGRGGGFDGESGGRLRQENGGGGGGGGGGSSGGAIRAGGAVSSSSSSSSSSLRKGFRKIIPNAAGANARLGVASSSSASSSSSSGGAGAAGAAANGEGSAAGAGAGAGAVSGNDVKARVLKSIAGGGRGAFGRSNDSTREDRILEGMPPDGTGDLDATA